MGHKEALQKRIDNLENKMRYYRTILLTLATGIVWSVYAIMEHKADNKILILSGVGVILFLIVLLRLKSYEIETNELIDDKRLNNGNLCLCSSCNRRYRPSYICFGYSSKP